VVRTKALVAGLAAIAVVGVGSQVVGGDDPYEVSFMVPSAEGAIRGGTVTLAGQPAGRIADIDVVGDRARLTLELDPSAAPLRSGVQARLAWNSAVGRRTVELTDGAEANPELPEGMLIESTYERVELDDIAEALDEKTRSEVRSLVSELDGVLEGNEKTLNDTLLSAGPFAESLGAVVEQVGSDGPAIRRLVTELRAVVKVLADRDVKVAGTVDNLHRLVEVAASRQSQISEALGEVPSTVQVATTFFNTVPDAVDQVTPLLDGLEPATDQLPAAAKRLAPVLVDLRPTVAELRPTLTAANELLDQTPGMLSLGGSVVGDLDSTLSQLQPALSFLRPYTPEVIGFLTNWTSLFSAKNASGHFGRALIPASASTFNGNPGMLPPGMTQGKEPAPGSLVGQSWTDANGDSIR
jgi:phospholipid/cholesterol/gamma-HCH transport system substrate-binding protein